MTEYATEAFIIRQIRADEARERAAEFAAILLDCVQGGASVGFMAPLSRDTADGFWKRVAEGVAAGDRILLAAEDVASGEFVGTVQLLVGVPENQPHRADVAKMLVRRSARRRGLGAALMRAAAEAAWQVGRTLLVLDTVTGGDAERLYESLGWVRVGVVPGYALMPDGAPCDTTFFYKSLGDG
ncbi:GNAT family N-acetyltransferase [Longimicrobium terrae]|uniref:GNAT superfamily N-acetyltransferase n=1 Tax=Longimicrobium terrae TaxID=1639882 RepID=A0A841H1X5_9BACT|nr:GNAT superfamily N-acetyltransferase [Longimicrobium terrae]MBB6071978.1 GNAT superfamily N-acetyltransferase [Longimicrobium terrae]NNC30522.1 GNAT family N-acetyltransferase [Longimicrobium terrae]